MSSQQQKAANIRWTKKNKSSEKRKASSNVANEVKKQKRGQTSDEVIDQIGLFTKIQFYLYFS